MTSSPTTRLHQELKPVHCNQLEDTYMHLVFHTLPQDCIMSSNPVHGHQLEALLRIFGPTDDEAFADDYQSIIPWYFITYNEIYEMKHLSPNVNAMKILQNTKKANIHTMKSLQTVQGCW